MVTHVSNIPFTSFMEDSKFSVVGVTGGVKTVKGYQLNMHNTLRQGRMRVIQHNLI